MVPFAGYAMPVQFEGILAEHRHTREAAGLFDVSHMGQIVLSGDGAAAALERLTPANVVGLAPGRQRYLLFTNDAGGILDDAMVCHAGDHLHLVVNAACKKDDLAHLQRSAGGDMRIEPRFDRALLALQGPQAGAVMARLAPGADDLRFMSGAALRVAGIDCFVTRSGYTGEDGFEIATEADGAEALAEALLGQDEVRPVGLGARDSLRLEAGLCLYGHDIDTGTTPIEADLAWAIPKIRRPGGARAGGYPGAAAIEAQLADGVARRRVGLRPDGRAPVREGAVVVDESGAPVGTVSSGGFGATVGGPVAMGYVETRLAEPGTRLAADLRGRTVPLDVVALPFVAHGYRR